MRKITPIFVIGVQRSGTTWLANLLCQHSKIVGIQSNRNFGIRASTFFSRIEGIMGDLSNDDNFIKFLSIYSNSDYFFLSKLNLDIFFERRPKTYSGFFRIFMDEFAKNEEADFWVEKSPRHSLYLEKISNYYKDAKFLAIKRNILDTIKSTIRLAEIEGEFDRKIQFFRYFSLLYNIYRYVQHYKYIKHFTKISNSIKVINFEDLKESEHEVIKDICKFLNIKFEIQMTERKYDLNTSFTSKNERKRIQSQKDKIIIKIISGILSIFPYWMYKLIHLEKLFIQSIRKKQLTPDFYSFIKADKLKNSNL